MRGGGKVHKNSIPFLFLLQRGKRVSVIMKVPFATEGLRTACQELGGTWEGEGEGEGVKTQGFLSASTCLSLAMDCTARARRIWGIFPGSNLVVYTAKRKSLPEKKFRVKICTRYVKNTLTDGNNIFIH